MEEVHPFFDEGLAMLTKLADIQLWQRNLASLIRSGLFLRAETDQLHGLYAVYGIYVDGTRSAPLAKYADARRASDAADLANSIARSAVAADAN